MPDYSVLLNRARELASRGQLWEALKLLENAQKQVLQDSAGTGVVAAIVLEQAKLWCRARWLPDTDVEEASERASAVERVLHDELEAEIWTTDERASAWLTCGRCAFGYGRFRDAADYYLRVLGQLDADREGSDSRAVEAMLYRAESLRRCDMLDEAHRVAIRAYGLLRQIENAQPWYLAVSAAQVGRVLMALSRAEDAEPFLEEAAETARGRFATYHAEVEDYLRDCRRALDAKESDGDPR